MNPIEFISAGAGSGKTFRLTQILSDALADGSCRPQAVLATTFTVKAAAELRQRARSRLLTNRRLDLATAIGQARIGTVNSVCGQLLKHFCFEIGLAPAQDVLVEAEAKRLVTTAIEGVLTDDVLAELMMLTGRLGFDHDGWISPIRDVLNSARSNDIAPEPLAQMGYRNADALLSTWPKPDESCDHTAALVCALDQAIELLSDAIADGSEVKKTAVALDKLRTCRRQLEDGSWSWTTWLAVTNVDPEAKLKLAVAPAVEAAHAHGRHPQFHKDIRRYLELTFGLAASALDTFAQAKRDLGVVDFADQESLLLRALRESEQVRSGLSDCLDLVLVDEFQDTSPLQLALFVELAKLAKRSVWVGDPKQAIYGFRGTDPRLISQVVEAVEGWGGKLGEPLNTSRRSTPALVSLVNAVFVPAFNGSMSAEEVKLQPHRIDIPDQPSIFDWTFVSPNQQANYLGLGPAIAQLLASGFQVVDKEVHELRPIRPDDIGVLCRRNDEVDLAVAALSHHGIATASARPGLLSTPEALLVLGCLRRLHDPGDTLATALIVSLSDCAQPEDWLADRFAYLKSGSSPGAWKTKGEGAHKLVARLETLRSQLSCLSPSEAMRLARSESHIAFHAAKWSATAQQTGTRVANVEALVEMAVAYENACLSAKRPATVAGLLTWLGIQASAGQDLCAASTVDAIEVLTNHKAKGLEWPVTILTGLGQSSRSALWGVRARTDGVFDPDNPLQRRFVHYWPNPYGKYKKPQPAIDAEASPTGVQMTAEALEESKRLLYVSFTRARDALALVSFKKSKPAREWVDETGASGWLFGPSATLALPDGVVVQRSSMEYTADECAAAPNALTRIDSWWYERGKHVERQPLSLQPSSTDGGAFATDVIVRVGNRIVLNGAGDMTAFGSAIHNCIALAFSDRDKGLDIGEVTSILERWGVGLMADAASVAGQVTALAAWLDGRWTNAKVMVEVPIETTMCDGRRLRGQIDLLVDTPAGWILVDHKADPRSARGDDRIALSHGPQLSAYAAALHAATGRHVLERWIFLPVAAQAVRLVDA